MDPQMTSSLVMFAAIILIFYFLIIRPQKKREKETKDMLNALKKGDKVVSIGGIHGTVISVKENTVVVKVDDNARIEFTKSAISQVLNKESVKTSPKKEKKAKEAEMVEAPKAEEDVKADEAVKAEEPAKAEESK
ncbi:MAG: preprotein translocase subunit YajC [Spirochaetales bacterium]|nr:preprotein translocase subunit YajC [Spirochaetales bacterium]